MRLELTGPLSCFLGLLQGDGSLFFSRDVQNKALNIAHLPGLVTNCYPHDPSPEPSTSDASKFCLEVGNPSVLAQQRKVGGAT
ncbi:MAG: hypothetical protein CSYNP_04475 [Syntrophus sp. SKADARSKE-3]|nr:hypothetical protein [Syntrophus sp. SKADARSKE-3]